MCCCRLSRSTVRCIRSRRGKPRGHGGRRAGIVACTNARPTASLHGGLIQTFRQPAILRSMATPERNLRAVREAPPWQPDTWRARTAQQQPVYEDAGELERALTELSSLPPLVTSWEVLALKHMLAEAQEGKRFLLQGGDCAESFADCNNVVIANRLKVLLQMSLVLIHGLRVPVVRVGRFAGQYAKPRSADLETRDGATLPCYRGDLVNAAEFDAASRRSAANAARPRAFGDDDEFRARAGGWRLRGFASSRILEPVLGRAFAAGRR